MLIINLRKTTLGNSGNVARRGAKNGKSYVKPYKKMSGNGCCQDVYDMACTPNIKPTEVLRNINIKKSICPKKYIAFE
jgi:hypothetical protein